MDLVAAVREKVDSLSAGEHSSGLRAVLLHIETAVEHLDRGKTTATETAFTDAIYRTNQAYEGSLKEAYRVLAGKEPAKKTPYQIEDYLTKNEVFRSRVLSQLTTYRTEWRNPSTHDYKIDFDSSEALLAIVSVTAFTVLLLDQISEKFARDASKEATDERRDIILNEVESSPSDLHGYISALLGSYALKPLMGNERRPATESELLGSIAGYLESVERGISVRTHVMVEGALRMQADLLIERDAETIVVEVKQHETRPSAIQSAVYQLEHMVQASGSSGGILLAVADSMSIDFEDVKLESGVKITVIKEKEMEVFK